VIDIVLGLIGWKAVFPKGIRSIIGADFSLEYEELWRCEWSLSGVY